jgi:hypothetical protein
LKLPHQLLHLQQALLPLILLHHLLPAQPHHLPLLRQLLPLQQ